ncbi:MAG: AAA family ATPase, partial [Acetobacteraceae bacterium]
AQVAKAVAKRRPTCLPPDDAARLAAPAHLQLSLRKGQSGDDYLRRLATLLGANENNPAPERLNDLPGLGEAAEWGRALARDMRDYREGRIAWAMVDRGALLTGPPGVGKSTFARALAHECGVPLIATSYAQWQSHREGHLGNVIEAMRAAFDEARSSAPSILFIDELDTLGVRGGQRRFGDWWRSITNSLLELLDGIAGREGVVVIGATNDAAEIDPAVVRSGRMDRVIEVGLPNPDELAQILRVHLGGDLAGEDLSAAAWAGIGGTGADAERWIRGARRRARREKRRLALADLLAEVTEPSDSLSPAQWRTIAIHEAGHAVAGTVLNPGSVACASIHRSQTLQTFRRLVGATAADLRGIVVGLLAGRAAEQELLGNASVGAGGGDTSDLARATALLTLAEASLGFGSTLTWRGDPDTRQAAAMIATDRELDARVSAHIADAYAEARRLIGAHRAAVEAVAEALLARGVVTGGEVEALIAASGTSPGTGHRPAPQGSAREAAGEPEQRRRDPAPHSGRTPKARVP